jgi:hypothetical protein
VRHRGEKSLPMNPSNGWKVFSNGSSGSGHRP